MATAIKHYQTNVQRIDLMHLTQHAPTSTQQIGWYVTPINGRAIGLKLEFPDGHTCCLTYEEIGQLKAAAENFNSE